MDDCALSWIVLLIIMVWGMIKFFKILIKHGIL